MQPSLMSVKIDASMAPNHRDHPSSTPNDDAQEHPDAQVPLENAHLSARHWLGACLPWVIMSLALLVHGNLIPAMPAHACEQAD